MEQDLTGYVDLRWGVDNEGNTVIGPQRPNASINPGPDTKDGGHGGYLTGHPIRGFSQIHASGTGWGKYGEFLLSPQLGLATGFEEHDAQAQDEEVSCCAYAVTLERYGIRCRVVPAEHAAIYRFSYPACEDASLLLDMAHSIPLMARLVNTPSGISASDLSMRMTMDEDGYPEVRGSGFYAGGFGGAHALHFAMQVRKRPEAYGWYDGDGLHAGETAFHREQLRSRTESVGAYLRFSTTDREDIMVRIGVSFLSEEKAAEDLRREIPAWDDEALAQENRAIWNRELARIRLGEGVAETQKKVFYTAMYHALCMPRDRTGDLPGYGPEVPMMDDHYATWDTWRTLYPLYVLIRPDLVRRTIRSYIARLARSGYVRDAFVGGVEMNPQQGGDDVDNVICDAYVKGLPGLDREEWEQAYRVVKNHADHFRAGWYCEMPPAADPDSPYHTLGYIPEDYWIPGTEKGLMACSYTLEAAYNDACAARMARDLGTAEDAQRYARRSENWKNLWNPDCAAGDFRGFICPRRSDGSWADYDPTAYCASWVPHFYEATGFNYSFFVPQDVPGLIAACGGEEAFIERLMYGIRTGLVDYGNEPAFLASYLFAYTKKPWLIADCVRELRARFTLEGPPGNDDSGAMSSWYIFSSLGFFPSAGQDLYFLTAPAYPHAKICLGGGGELEITAENLSEKNRYIQRVRINGRAWNSAMFPHEAIRDGGRIDFVMGEEPADYTKEESIKGSASESA